MKLYTVVPIARGVFKETLSYFGNDTIEAGSLVKIPLRSKSGFGIVIDSRRVEDVKTEIRKGSFAMKKIEKVISKEFLSKAFLEAALKTAQFYAATTGSVLENLLPKLFLEHAHQIKLEKSSKKSSLSSDRLVVQASDTERFAHYKSFIRGQFARRSSVFFVLPTVEDIKKVKTILEKGIDQYTIVLHGNLGKKEFQSAYKIIEKEKHPLLIIGTAPFLSIERKDIGAIILDRENSRGYKSFGRPFIDYRRFVENLAQAHGVPLLYGDILLSLETLYKTKREEYAEFAPIKMRSLSPAEGTLVDMKSQKGEFESSFKILSPELLSLIEENKKNNEHLFIWSARKGIAPSTVCGDCGKLVTCSRCGTPVTLYGGNKDKENFFMCNICGLERDARERCIYCESWKLKTLGIGIEQVEQSIKDAFPDIKVFTIDKEHIKTEKKASDLMHRFENSPGSVLVGTELALFYLKEEIDNVGVGSIDSLFALPDFRIREKILYNLITLRSRAQKNFLIQTRNADEMIFDYALKGNMIDFYKNEMHMREEFKYPPFSLFIKLSLEGKGKDVEPLAEEISVFLKEFSPQTYEAFSPSKRGNRVFHILIRKDKNDWPDQKLLELLHRLPPYVSIKVDPESLL